MPSDQQRLERIQRAIVGSNWDALICSLPTNVLLLSCYWPVVGTSLAVATKDGQVGLVVPEDEHELAGKSWAHELCTFEGGSLDEIKTATKAVRAPLSQLAKKLKITGAIGYEAGDFHEPSSYASMHFFGGTLRDIISEAVPNAQLVSADDQLKALRSVKTPK